MKSPSIMENSSNTKSHGKFLSKIRPLLLRKDIIQDCFDHCAITDSSLKLLSTISVQGSVRLRVTGRKCQGLHLITLLRNFYLLQIRQLGLMQLINIIKTVYRKIPYSSPRILTTISRDSFKIVIIFYQQLILFHSNSS